MKRISLIVLSLILTMCLFTGCGNSDPFINPGDDFDVNIDMNDEDYNQTATLTVGITADPAERTLIEAAGNGFKQLFPNVKVEPTVISGQDYSSAVLARIKGGSMPDLFYSARAKRSALFLRTCSLT